MELEKISELVNLGKTAVEKEGFTVRYAEHVGSRYITGGYGNDFDVLILIEKPEFQNGIGMHVFGDESWKYDGSHPCIEPHCGDDRWGSWKKAVDGEFVNIIITEDEGWYWNFIKSAEVCRFIHLMSYAKEAGINDEVMGRAPFRTACHERELRYGIHNILMEDSTAMDELKRFKDGK